MLFVLILCGLFIAGCGSGAGVPEEPCFEPGVACGNGFCSLSAYCDTGSDGGNAVCKNQGDAGESCAADEQCLSLDCADGGCIGAPATCEEELSRQ